MQLSAEQAARFEADGYLVVRGALEEGDLNPVIEEHEAAE